MIKKTGVGRGLRIAAGLLIALSLGACEPPEKKLAEMVHEDKAGFEALVKLKGGPVCRYDSCFNPVEQLEGLILALRGVTLRKFFMLDIYTVALYLPEDVDTQDTVVPDGPKIIILDYHRQIEKAKVVAAIEDNVGKNPRVDQAAVHERFDKLTRAFDPPHKGDRYIFSYVPGKGTSLIKDGVERVVIPGDDFAFAFFGIWTSPHGEDKKMRTELLALK